METKDLILLIAIPVLLISIIYYADTGLMTGAATAKSENEILGVYSVLPSFRAKIGYNIKDEYGKLKADLKKMIDECKTAEKDNMEKCMRRKSSEKGWGCVDDEAAKILVDFVDKITECINLVQENVVCRFSLDKTNYINKQKSIRNFRIELTNWYYGKSKTELKEDDKVIASRFVNLDGLSFVNDFAHKDTDITKLKSVIIDFSYRDEKPAIAKVTGEIEDAKSAEKQKELAEAFQFYKSKDGVRFISKYQLESFSIPSMPANTIIDLPKTKGLAFCAKSGKQAAVYDASDELVKPRDIVYRFAISLPKSAPGPIKNLNAHYAKKTENSLMLAWDRPKEDDAVSYSIYYSKKEFADDKIEDIKNNADINKISAPNIIFREIEDINLEDNCMNLDAPCKYSVYGQQLEKEKLYYWKDKNKFIYIVKNAEDDVQYNFAVTAANEEGEISNDKSVPGNTYVLELNKNYVRFASKDDLAPGIIKTLQWTKTPEGKIKLLWDKPLKNLDGTSMSDLADFNIYYKKSTSDLLPQLEMEHGVKKITAKDAKCDTVSISCEFNLEDIQGLEKGQPYNFAVTALDKKSNEYKFESGKIALTIQ